MENYDIKFEQICSTVGKNNKLLLQACCAPCSSAVLERVTPYFDVTLYFYNPNITEKGEYDKRLSELYRFVATVYGDKVKIVDGGFNADRFFEYSKKLESEPERGARCTNCYLDRLTQAAIFAKENGFDYFGTTLTVSPHKDSLRLNTMGEKLEQEYSVKFLYSDFKKKNGYRRSIELSREYNLYRQNYCGCIYSKKTENQ